MGAIQVCACIAAELSPTRILCPWNELRGPEQKGWSRHGVRPHRPKENPQHPMCPRAAGWSWPCAAATQLPPPPTPISSICFQSQHHPNPFGRTPPPRLPLLPNAFVFPRRGCSAPACIHASATCCMSLEPTASQRDRERESEQWCCGWALPLCPRALGTAPACCPQCHQGDGAAVCTKLAKVRAAVRGAGCVNAIF